MFALRSFGSQRLTQAVTVEVADWVAMLNGGAMVWGFCVYFVYMIPLETDVLRKHRFQKLCKNDVRLRRFGNSQIIICLTSKGGNFVIKGFGLEFYWFNKSASKILVDFSSSNVPGTHLTYLLLFSH